MNDSDIGELLKAAKDVQLLNAGINTGIVVSTYPTKEHRDLLRNGKPGITPLNTTLGFRNARVPTDPKDPNYSQRHLIQTYRTNALTMTFKGHRNARVAKIEWQEFYLHLLPLVMEHPKLLMTGGKDKVTQTINKLFKPSADFIGDASLNMELQNTMKVKSLCLPILAENPFAKGDKEKELITAIALEDQGIADVPEQSDADDLRKHENVKVQYERALAYIRELTNHTFLRAIYLTSSHQAQIEYKEVQQTFLLENAAAKLVDGYEPIKFTALNIIDHIEKECLCENDKSLVLIQNTFNELIRHNGQTPLKWLQSMLPIQLRYRKALGKDLSPDEERRVWKLHFARQITVAEQTTIITFTSKHLEATEMLEIAKLTEGTFDEHILQKLFTRLTSSFATYAPDKSVMDYLHQHSSSLQWEKKLDFRTPREKQSQDTRPNKHEKRKERPKERLERPKERTGRNKERTKRPDRGASQKRLKTSRPESGPRPRIPETEQCRRPACVERGNHLNHTHAKCRFANSGSNNRFSNLGKAPAKKTKTTGSSSGGKSQAPAHKPKQPAPKSLTGASSTEKRLCYICSSEDHLANACPQKEQNKSRARKTLTKDRNFMALWDEKFETPEEQQCATRILEAWDDTNVCPKCIQPMESGHKCDKNDAPIYNHLDYVRQAIGRSLLLRSIKEAHQNQPSTDNNTSPITMGENFFTAAEGQYSSSEDTSNQSTSPRRRSDTGDLSDQQGSTTEAAYSSGANDSDSDSFCSDEEDRAYESGSDDSVL